MAFFTNMVIKTLSVKLIHKGFCAFGKWFQYFLIIIFCFYHFSSNVNILIIILMRANLYKNYSSDLNYKKKISCLNK